MSGLQPSSQTACILLLRYPLETRKEGKRGQMKEEQKRGKLYQEKSQKGEKTTESKGKSNKEAEKE